MKGGEVLQLPNEGICPKLEAEMVLPRDRPASGHRSDLPKFSDVLEATPKKSLKNILNAFSF
jgi:hypothetical protein